MSSLGQFPAYVTALRRGERLDDYRRDFPFLGLTEQLNIAGAIPRTEGEPRTGHSIEVNQLTLKMFVELCAVRSPFLVGGHLGPEHVAQILWRISPQYDRRNARAEFVESIAGLPFQHTIRAINRYLDRMFLDKPPTSTKNTGSRPDTSLAASLIHHLANAYSWSDEQILNTPMPRLFQYLRLIQRDANPELLYHNPTRDKLKARAFNKIREQFQDRTPSALVERTASPLVESKE